MRADGKRVKNADPMYTVAAHIMSKRTDAMNMITIDIPVEPMKEYINEKRKQGINISHMSVVLAAYIRTMKEFPELNRFVVNKKIYQRNEIAVGMVVLKPGEMGVVKTHKVKGTLGKHLREMGLVNGIPIKLERKAPLGYPVEIRIQGFSLALRKEEAQAIELE